MTKIRSPALERRALVLLIEGKSIQKIAADICVAIDTIFEWRKNPDFERRWLAARRQGVETQVDSLLDVHERMSHFQARIVSDNLRWRAARLMPETFGDRIDLTQGVTAIDITKALTDARARAGIEDKSIVDAELVEARLIESEHAGSSLDGSSDGNEHADSEELKKLLE